MIIPINKLNAILSAVAPVDAGYNRRLVEVLQICGYEVVAGLPNAEQVWMPMPWHEGWQFPYPSMITIKPVAPADPKSPPKPPIGGKKPIPLGALKPPTTDPRRVGSWPE